MSLPIFETLLAVLIVSGISLLGVVTLYLNDTFLKKILLVLVSFSAGALFGDVFYHILPEAVESAGGLTTTVASGTILGILVFFVLEKFLHWHHHHAPHKVEERHGKHEAEQCVESYATMNLVGDGLHNLLDGVIIAGSFMASIPLGIATTVAVALHEIPQELGDFGVLLKGGFSKRQAVGLNFLSALVAVLGAGLTLMLGNSMSALSVSILPFTAGGFLYIAGSDLLPELRKEPGLRKTLVQFVALVAGILVMRSLLFIE